jgi:hypothetical protein
MCVSEHYERLPSKICSRDRVNIKSYALDLSPATMAYQDQLSYERANLKLTHRFVTNQKINHQLHHLFILKDRVTSRIHKRL